MPEQAVVEPSAASSPQGGTEANPSAIQQETGAVQTQSIDQKFEKALADLKAKETGDKTEEVAQPPETTEAEVGESQAEVEPEGDYVETVKYGDKEMGLNDLFAQAEFEVPFRGEMKTIEGNKLVELAAIGLGASEANRNAKQTIAEAQRIINESKASAEKQVQEGITNGVAKELQRLIDDALNGVNPSNGQQFRSPQEKQETVNLLADMKRISQASTPKEPVLTRDEIAKLVEEQTGKRLQAMQSEAQQQRIVQEITNAAKTGLQKATEPLMHQFVLEDGKTLNSGLFKRFQKAVEAEADEAWIASGKPTDPTKITDFISKAAQSVLKDYRGSLRVTGTKAPEKKPSAPVVKPSSGAPLAQQTQGKKLPANKLQDQRWDAAMAAIKGGKGR